MHICIFIMCHHNNYTGRLLRKAEDQYSDFHVQLAAHLLLEVYQELGIILILDIWEVAQLLRISVIQIPICPYMPVRSVVEIVVICVPHFVD